MYVHNWALKSQLRYVVKWQEKTLTEEYLEYFHINSIDQIQGHIESSQWNI